MSLQCKSSNAPSPDSLSFLRDRLLSSIRLSPRRSGSLPLALTLLPRGSRTRHTLRTIKIFRWRGALLPRILSNLIIVLIERLARFFQLALHTQQLLHTTQFIRVSAQREPEIIDLDLLSACVVRNLRRAVAQF